MEPKVADDLVPLLHPVADLHELPGNPRRGDVEAVKRSYEAFGQRKPIVAKHDGEGRAVVVAGNHQLKAVRELGWDEVAVVWADDLSDDQARGFALADNRTADLGDYDDEALVAMLSSLDDIEGTGYTAADLDGLMEALEAGDGEGVENGQALQDLGDVTLDAQLTHEVSKGDVWKLGHHVLVCCSVLTEHEVWSPWLESAELFCPFPGAFAPLTDKAEKLPMLLVHPDPFLASHIVTKYAAVKGAGEVYKT